MTVPGSVESHASRASAWVVVLGALLATSGCTNDAKVPFADTIGPEPTLAAPVPSRIPTVSIAPPVGWPAGAGPTSADGLSVQAFATGLDHPRWLYVLPNGALLVADDVGNTIWRVQGANGQRVSQR
jgi:glucose/arabinose dehydrogenase